MIQKEPSLNILTIVPSYKPAYVYGGPIRSIGMLCETFAQAGHNPVVFTTNANGAENLSVHLGRPYDVNGVAVTYFKRLTKGTSNFSLSLVRRMLSRKGQFDIIHLQSWGNPLVMTCALLLLVRGIIPIISPRGTLTQFTFQYRKSMRKKMVHYLVGKYLLERSVIHVTSQQEREEMAAFVNPKRIYIIPNLLEIPNQVYGKPEKSDSLSIVFIGRIDPVKNLEMLLQVLNEKINFPFNLTIAGEGDHAYVQKLKSRIPDRMNIVWAGNIDGEEKYKLLAKSDLCVLPSITENYGNVVIEALSQGTPSLISNHVGAKDFILEHHLGWVVELNPDVWAKALNQIWKERDKIDQIRAIAPAIVKRYLNPSELINQYIQMYRDHLGDRTYN